MDKKIYKVTLFKAEDDFISGSPLKSTEIEAYNLKDAQKTAGEQITTWGIVSDIAKAYSEKSIDDDGILEVFIGMYNDDYEVEDGILLIEERSLTELIAKIEKRKEDGYGFKDILDGMTKAELIGTILYFSREA